MPRPELGLVASTVKDPMLSMDFQLEFPNVPTGTKDEQLLLIHCQQASKPGLTIENVEVQLFGHTLEFAGRLTYSHDLSVTLVENVRGEIQRILENWMEVVRFHKTQHGEFKSGYARDAKLTIFDNKGGTPLIYKIFNVWPSALPEVSFSGSESNIVTLGVTFKYDYYEKAGGYTS